ncbi:hypothetical protein AA0118_g9554 [Alternaria tenuissima]|nr:hypothetical protein AA0118_g9554 [Alternaria tenuissima]
MSWIKGFQLSWLEIIRSEPSPPPIFQWMMAFSGGFMYMCGPTEPQTKSAEFMKQNTHDCDKDILIPGMLPMTCHDLNPQDVGDKAIKIQIAKTTMTQFAQRADGLLTACAPEYDSVECLGAISDWIACQRGRQTFHVGPMLPLTPGTTTFFAKAIEVEINTCPDGSGIVVTRFLDRCMSSHGRHSVFYISFGTEHWPSSLNHLEILLDAMVARKYPFLLAHAHADAQTISKLKNRYLANEEALILPFVPQQTVLSHEQDPIDPSRIFTCLRIGWPFAIDQPLNITHMAHTMDAGFEFTQMRANYCPVKAARSEDVLPDMDAWEKEVGDVLAAAFTAVGERKRRNAELIGKNLGKAWAENSGRARLQLSKFLDTVGV